MRTLLASIMLLGSLALLMDGVRAQDAKKEVELKGKITCAKCDLSVTDECATVIVVTDAKKKETIYYFDAAGHKKHHAPVCTTSKNGVVTGVVSEDGKKKIVTVKTLKFD